MILSILYAKISVPLKMKGLFKTRQHDQQCKISYNDNTLYVLIFSFLFLVSEFLISNWFTIPNTCSITASWRKSSLPYTDKKNPPDQKYSNVLDLLRCLKEFLRTLTFSEKRKHLST